MDPLMQQDETKEKTVSFSDDHPWLEVSDGTLDESILYSLDELRFV